MECLACIYLLNIQGTLKWICTAPLTVIWLRIATIKPFIDIHFIYISERSLYHSLKIFLKISHLCKYSIIFHKVLWQKLHVNDEVYILSFLSRGFYEHAAEKTCLQLGFCLKTKFFLWNKQLCWHIINKFEYKSFQFLFLLLSWRWGLSSRFRFYRILQSINDTHLILIWSGVFCLKHLFVQNENPSLLRNSLW